MNYFQVADKINQLHQLDIAERALLNQITSYYFNNKQFFATNEYLSEYWGISERTITRYISKLTKFGYITVRTEKRKHEVGSGFWYNKRYIMPVINSILGMIEEPEEIPADEIEISTTETSVESPIEAVLTLEYIEETSETPIIEDDEPYMGEFAEQDNEYTREMAEATKVAPTTASEYNHEAVLEMIDATPDLKKIMENAKAKEIPIDKNYTEQTFFYVIKAKAAFMEEYRAIISKLVAV